MRPHFICKVTHQDILANVKKGNTKKILFFANKLNFIIFVKKFRYGMIVFFEKKYLRELYEKGKANDKKHRFQPEIVRKYKYCINLMRYIPDTTALAKYKGLNFENLKGNKAGICSIRVNKQYRIEFTVTDSGVDSIVNICRILELSNHYQ